MENINLKNDLIGIYGLHTEMNLLVDLYYWMVRAWALTNLFLLTPSSNQEVLKYMAEVMICRGGSGNGGGGVYDKILKTEWITENTIWTVPTVINNEFYVQLVGGGGGSGVYGDANGSGGGSGWLTQETLYLIPGDIVSISIGNGGKSVQWHGKDGGTTSFGTYLIANGGQGGNYQNNRGGNGGAGGFGREYGGTGYLWGGGATLNTKGGDGGVWGGGAGGNWYGGNGGIYGGGGGMAYGRGGGNGGKYGGGGGSSGSSYYGIGGEYGGNGGAANGTQLSENGTNTIGWNNVASLDNGYTSLSGAGLRGCVYLQNYSSGITIWELNNSIYNLGGGGGFGGNGGHGLASNIRNDKLRIAGGGGGYGSNGGDISKLGLSFQRQPGSGGGGYGGDGGYIAGGGYGKQSTPRGYGGGGYYQNTDHSGGAGALGYGNGGTTGNQYNITDNMNGQQGVCVIQYWIKG